MHDEELRAVEIAIRYLAAAPEPLGRGGPVRRSVNAPETENVDTGRRRSMAASRSPTMGRFEPRRTVSTSAVRHLGHPSFGYAIAAQLPFGQNEIEESPQPQSPVSVRNGTK